MCITNLPQDKNFICRLDTCNCLKKKLIKSQELRLKRNIDTKQNLRKTLKEIERALIARGYKKIMFQTVLKELSVPIGQKDKKITKCENRAIFPVEYYTNHENKGNKLIQNSGRGSRENMTGITSGCGCHKAYH